MGDKINSNISNDSLVVYNGFSADCSSCIQACIRNQQQRIRVFISSRCDDDGPYYQLRSDLAKTLDSFGFFKAYIWERSGASTATAVENYRMELRDSNVCVFIIDLSVTISEGVRNEIDEAKNLRKKQMFYLFGEPLKENETFYNELKGPNAPTYKLVDKDSDIKTQVVIDLFEDLLRIYRGWCNNAIDFGGDDSANVGILSARTTSQLKKDCYSSISGTQESLASVIFGPSSIINHSSSLDEACMELVKALYFDFSISKFNPSKITQAAADVLPKPYISTCKKRWDAIRCYFSEDINGSIDALKGALEEARQNNLDDWFVGDILIDLRNVVLGLPNVIDSVYQNELTESPLKIVYPIIDRAEATLLEKLNRDEIKTRTQSIESFTFGSNSMGFFKEVAEIFVTATCFGSLTHIFCTTKHLKAIAFHLCNKYNDASLKTALLKLTIADGSRGDGEKTLQILPQTCFDDDSMAARDLLNFCINYKGLNGSGIAPFEAFKMVGCYLDNSDFIKAQSDIVHAAESALISADPWEPKPRSVFESLNANYSRMPKEWVFDFCIRCIKCKNSTWVNEALRFINLFLTDYDCSLDTWNFKELFAAIKLVFDSNNDSYRAHIVCNVLISISYCVNGAYAFEKDAVLNLLPKEEQLRFHESCIDACDNKIISSAVLKHVERLEYANKTQGINGAFTFGEDYAKLFAIYITRMSNTDFSLLRRGFSALIESLQSKWQDYDSKLSALFAIATLLKSFTLDEIDENGELKRILEDRSHLLSGNQIHNASAFLIDVCADILAVAIGVGDCQNLICSLVNCFESSQFTKAYVAKMLYFFVWKNL